MQDQLISDYIEFTHKNKDYLALHNEFQRYRVYEVGSGDLAESISKALDSQAMGKTAKGLFAAKSDTERSDIARQLLMGGFATLLSPVVSSVLCVMRALGTDQDSMEDAVQTYLGKDVEVEFEKDFTSKDEYVGVWASVWDRKGKPPFLLIQGATKDDLDPRSPTVPAPPADSQPVTYAWKPPTSSGGVGLGKKIANWFKSAFSSVKTAVSRFVKEVASAIHELFTFMIEDALAAGLVGATMGAGVGGFLGVGFGFAVGAPTLGGAFTTAAAGGAIGATVGATVWGVGGGLLGAAHGAFRFALTRATDGVMAFPDGSGDVVIGKIPGWPISSGGATPREVSA